MPRRASPRPPAATLAPTSPVYGSRSSNVPPPAASTHSPPMCWRASRTAVSMVELIVSLQARDLAASSRTTIRCAAGRRIGSMSKRTVPPFRADHVGSLLRPPELLAAREAHAAGRIDDDELRGVEDQAIRSVVRLQEDAGLQSATDGEFRRASWHMDFIYQLG